MIRRENEAWVMVSQQKNKVPLTSLHPAFGVNYGLMGHHRQIYVPLTRFS